MYDFVNHDLQTVNMPHDDFENMLYIELSSFCKQQSESEK